MKDWDQVLCNKVFLFALATDPIHKLHGLHHSYAAQIDSKVM